MSDLIYRQQAIDVLEEQLDYLIMLNKKDNPTAEGKWYGINWARNTIAKLPSAEPKVGEWIKNEHGLKCCSVCGKRPLQICYYNIYLDGYDGKDILSKYCPHCGSKMEGSE